MVGTARLHWQHGQAAVVDSSEGFATEEQVKATHKPKVINVDVARSEGIQVTTLFVVRTSTIRKVLNWIKQNTTTLIVFSLVKGI